MDLRIIKTKKNIKNSFLALRSDHPLKKIRVTKLCETAMINKSTFYKHYQDVYDLSEKIENETIFSILNNFQRLDSLFDDPDGFIKGMYYAFKAHDDLIRTLFAGRMNILVDKIENELIILYPQFQNTPEKEIILSFIIRGATHVLSEPKYSEAVLLETLSEIITSIIMLDKNPNLR